MTSADIVFRNICLPPGGSPPVDIRVRDGVIFELGEAESLDGQVIENCGGALAIPGFVEGHCHLDKTHWGSDAWLPHNAGPRLRDRIEHDAEVRESWGIPSVDYAVALLRDMATHGTSLVRTHTHIDDDLGLRGVEVIAEATRLVSDLVTVEQVAFPQRGVLSVPGVADLMSAAMRTGAKIIGGIDPAGHDNDPVGQLNEVFALASRADAGIDFHLHDRGSLGLWEIALICERTRVEQMFGRVAISHAFALGDARDSDRDRVVGLLADSGVSIVTALPFNTPVLPVRELIRAGVDVALGHDSILDTWSPFGCADMLARSNFIAQRTECRRDEDLELIVEMATSRGAGALGVREPHGVTLGDWADFCLVSSGHFCDALTRVPPRIAVVRRGRVIARNGTLVDAAKS